MAERTLRIFISSPGDVGEERVIACRIVERLAGEFGQFLDLDPVLWEHEPLRATGHFVEEIVLPSKTDVVVCILWSRLGTRLPEGFTREDGTTYASGTEWEFEDAARSFREKGTPDLLVYRKTREAVAGLSDKQALLKRLEQKEALDAFIERWFGSPDESFKAAFHAFETADEFEGLLETHLRKLIAEQLPEHLTAAEGDIARVSWHAGSPFRGLEAFDFEHAPVFFGRTRAVGEVKRAIETQAARGTAFLTIFGMSGSGKSSLVRAGLLPTIGQPGVVERIGLWRWCTLRPSDATGDLFDGLAQALMGKTALPELSALKWDRTRLAEQFRSAPNLAAQPIEQALAATAEKAELATGAEARLALVVDQMEELFTIERVDEGARAAFIGVLASLARSGHVWVICAMRSDFYHRCAEAPELVALSEGAGQYHLVPPSPAEIAQIIRNPARAAGLRFEIAAETGEHLDDVLHAAAANDPAALPLLEFTLEELFKLRSDDGVLTFAAYERLGGLEGALARRAEEVFASLEAPVQAALPAVLRALVTVGIDEEKPVAARRVPFELVVSTPEQKALVDAFVEARLLVTDKTDYGTAVVRVAHEALLEHWPRLQEWLDENREVLRAGARIAGAAARWRNQDRHTDFLLREGKPLMEAEDLLTRGRKELDAEVVKYIEASAEELRRRLEEREAKERRKRRRTRFVVAAISVEMFLALFGAGIFYLLTKRAEDSVNQFAYVDGVSLRAVTTMDAQLEEIVRATTVYALDAGDVDREHLKALVFEFSDAATTYMRLATIDESRRLANDALKSFTVLHQMSDEIIVASDRSRAETAALRSAQRAIESAINTRILDLVDRTDDVSKEKLIAVLGMDTSFDGIARGFEDYLDLPDAAVREKVLSHTTEFNAFIDGFLAAGPTVDERDWAEGIRDRISSLSTAGDEVMHLIDRKQDLLTRFSDRHSELKQTLVLRITPHIEVARLWAAQKIRLSTFTTIWFLVAIALVGVVIAVGSVIVFMRMRH